MAASVPRVRELPLTPTVDNVRRALSGAPVVVSDIVERILELHRSDYAGDEAVLPDVSWPQDARRLPVEQWLARAAALIRPEAHSSLHGRVAILALGLVDSRSGRAMVHSGLFNAIARQLKPPLYDSLSEQGARLLQRIPLAATACGFPARGLSAGAKAYAVAFDGSGRLAVGGEDDRVRIFEPPDWQETATIGVEGAATALAFSPDGAHVATGGAQGARVWTLEGELEAQFSEPGHVYSLAFSPDGTFVAAAGEHGANLHGYNLETADRTFGEGGHAYSVAFGPEDRLAVGFTGAAEVYSTRVTGEHRRFRHDGRVAAVALSPDGSWLATAGGDGVARVWDLGGSLYREFRHEEAESIEAVAFSHDGSLLATGSADRSARVWSLATGAEVARVELDWGLYDVAFSPDSNWLATASLLASVHDVSLGRRQLRISGYSTDDARRGRDLLGLDRDVDALAQLIATTTVVPPLSVGIFGDWGSGKSFFMNRLANRVDELAEEARASGELQREIAFYKQIIQVEFNAWHYSEGDLWASLVEHILANLRVDAAEGKDVVTRRQEALLKQLQIETLASDRATEKEAQAQKALAEAEERLQKAIDEHDRLRRELADAASKDPLAGLAVDASIRDAVYNAIGAVGLPKVGEAARELDAAAREARTVVERGNSVVTPLIRAQDKDRRFRLLVVILVAAPAAALVAGALTRLLGYDGISTLSAFATGLATLLATGAGWLRSQAAWTMSRLDALDEAAKKLQAPIEEALAEQRHRQVSLEKELEGLMEQQRAAHREKEAQLDRVRAVEAELADATPSSLLTKFLQDRVESDDYRKRLGILALVRRDFQSISEYLAAQTTELAGFETLEQEEANQEGRINRIVLYIDDLDRCEPKTVVEVLQAVHLLLAFPLFVVVVAVDVRWLSRSLSAQYPNLLRGDDTAPVVSLPSAAPRDYLEKIFQIPFWVEPLDSGGSRRMLRGLLSDITGVADSATEDGARPPTDGASEPSGETEARTADGEPAPSDVVVAQSGKAVAVRLGPAPDLNPDSLELTRDELGVMEELATILGRSPRAVKRFVNVYRLIKASAQDTGSFIREAQLDSPHRCVMLLLAIETGLPSVAGELFLRLRPTADDTQTGERLQGLLAEIEGETSVDADELSRLTKLAGGSGWRWDPPLASLRRWANEVARFSFRVQHL